MLAVGVLLVLPQVVGFVVARTGRWRFPTVAWLLAAPGTIGLLWAISALADHHAAGHARTECSPEIPFWPITFSLIALHFVVGSILGVLDQRARTSR